MLEFDVSDILQIRLLSYANVGYDSISGVYWDIVVDQLVLIQVIGWFDWLYSWRIYVQLYNQTI